jgi:NAD(P)-dependent dehydrogenase (short-subunit alcohol dehydrogenase family)
MKCTKANKTNSFRFFSFFVFQQQVINNAGIELFGPLIEVDVDKFRLQMETNVTAVLVVW